VFVYVAFLLFFLAKTSTGVIPVAITPVDLQLKILKLFGAGDSAHVKRRLQDNQ
jgi:hypothetical protein